MSESRKVVVLSTGGTFEKRYDPQSEKMWFVEGVSIVPDILSDANVEDMEFKLIMSVDSADMLSEHRSRLLDAIEAREEEGVVIVHGTSTMVESARYLNNLGLGKCIVLTGALYPEQVRSREASFNLGAAIIAASTLPAGVYIAMNGKVLHPKSTRKDMDTGKFRDSE